MSASSSQRSIREFLKVRTSYDVLPLSFRLIVIDTSLLIKKSLNILIQNSEYTRAPDSAPAHPRRGRAVLPATLGAPLLTTLGQTSSQRHYGTPIPPPLPVS